MQVILGIDPGSQFTGYGAVRVQGDEIVHLEHGVISLGREAGFFDRLHLLSQELSSVIGRIRPDVAVVEKIFLGKNADSAFKLGHVRGVCFIAAAQNGSTMVEYATRSVKKGITGSGAASKEEVQLILFASLGIRTAARADASDALALAYYHARNLEVEKNLRTQLRGEGIL